MPYDQASLDAFFGANKDAVAFVYKGVDDYLLARMGIVSVLWSGFEMSTQAVEKLLKAYCLFKDPALTPAALKKMVEYRAQARGITALRGHDLDACLDVALSYGFSISDTGKTVVSRINLYYARRYPTRTDILEISTSELPAIDDVVEEIWRAFKPLNEDFYFMCGLFSTPFYHAQYADSGVYLFGNLWKSFSEKNRTWLRIHDEVRPEMAKRFAPSTWTQRFLRGDSMVEPPVTEIVRNLIPAISSS